MAENALARVKQAGVDLLRQKYEALQKKDLEIVRAMDRFAELPIGAEDPEAIARLLAMTDLELADHGWTRRELRMAIYATLPRARWPAAMQAAHERVGMRIRRQDRQPSKMQFNLNMVNIPAPKPSTDIVVLPDERDE